MLGGLVNREMDPLVSKNNFSPNSGICLIPERYFEFICRDAGSTTPSKGGSMSKEKGHGVWVHLGKSE